MESLQNIRPVQSSEILNDNFDAKLTHGESHVWYFLFDVEEPGYVISTLLNYSSITI